MTCTGRRRPIAHPVSRRIRATITVFTTGSFSLLLLFVPIFTACSQETNPSDGPVSWSEPIQVASGNGTRGPWRMNRSNFQYVDDPNAYLTRNSQIAMTWVNQSLQQIRFQRYDRNRNPLLDQPAFVSDSPDTFSWFPDVIMTDDDPAHVYVLWQEIVFSGGSHGGEAFFARSVDGGKTFEAPVNLSRTEAGDGKGRLTEKVWHNGSLDLAIGPNGTLFAAWTEYEGRLWFRYSTDAGQTFSDPIPVAGKQNQPPARGPSLAVASEQTVHIAWTVGERKTANIRTRTIDPLAGNMSEPRIVHRTTGLSDAPKLAVDDRKNLHLVYGERPASGGTDHVRYTRSTDGGNTFQEPVILSNPASAPHQRAGYPGLAVNKKRTVAVTWEGLDRDRFRSQPDRLMFSVSRDGGDTFSPPVPVPGTNAPENGFNGSQQGLLMGKLDLNRRNNLVVVNSNFVPDRRSRIYLITGSLSGR